MERKLRKDARVMWILKSLLVSYVLTGILLLLLAVALYKLELNEKAVSAAIVAIYIVSTLLGGIIIGKFPRVRRYLWGLGLGIGYFALLLLACWRWTGVNILYFLAGLQSISTDIYEAASIDGASKWQQFVKISFPLVKPTTVYVLTISIYAGLSMFTESYMLWKGNNSPQNIGLTIVGYLYRQGIEKRAMGYACAVGLILLIIVMAVNLVQLKATGTFDKEER